jgi:hypothetical protein
MIPLGGVENFVTRPKLDAAICKPVHNVLNLRMDSIGLLMIAWLGVA